MSDAGSRTERFRRRGANVAVVLYGVGLGGVTLWWTVQIMSQAWAPATGAAPDCRPGAQALLAAVRRAAEAASAETGGQRAALGRFREALLPEWSQRGAVTNACRQDPQGQRFLREVELLRYAEERSVRHAATDVARRRRGVVRLEAELSIATPPASSLAKPPTAH